MSFQIFDRILRVFGIADVFISGMLPHVLADENCDFFTFMLPDFRAGAWLEITPFIEDIVGRQKLFIVEAKEPPIAEDRCAVEDRLFPLGCIASDSANDDKETC